MAKQSARKAGWMKLQRIKAILAPYLYVIPFARNVECVEGQVYVIVKWDGKIEIFDLWLKVG